MTSRIEREILIRNYSCIVPTHTLIIIHNEHMIGKILSKAKLIEIGLFFSVCYQFVLYVKHFILPFLCYYIFAAIMLPISEQPTFVKPSL